MPDPIKTVVINTTPLIALSVAIGSLDILRVLYSRVIVTHEVQQEILSGGRHAPGSIGILAKAKQSGYPLDIEQVLIRLHNHGIWPGKDVKQFLHDNQ